MPHVLQHKKFLIPVAPYHVSTATGWTRAIDLTNGAYIFKSAPTAGTFKIFVPIPIPSISGEEGVKITSLVWPIRSTAAMTTAPTLVLYRRKLLAVAGATADNTLSVVTATKTGLTTSADANDRMITLSVTTPALDYVSTGDFDYSALLTVVPATSAGLRVYDACAYYDLCL